MAGACQAPCASAIRDTQCALAAQTDGSLPAKQSLASQQASCDFDRRHITVAQWAPPASRIAEKFGEISD
ncbi:hypothetical protein WS68_16980 [Burkholderia sp. TSV86]|nr:hypothetical protein WS68_16980 [Burkholderia sp. TSV86]